MIYCRYFRKYLSGLAHASGVGSALSICTTSHDGRCPGSAVDDLFDLYDMYNIYDLYDMYNLYDLCDLYDLYDVDHDLFEV